MRYIFLREIFSYFGSINGYVIGVFFLLSLGLILWVFPDFSILYYPYATLDSFFYAAPIVFLFMVPAMTMRSFSEEWRLGTMELLLTKPLSEWSLVFGKMLAHFVLVWIVLLCTVVYYWTVYALGSPPGNIDSGGVVGSYIGLALLGMVFVSIGLFSSVLTSNQVVAFLLAVFLSAIVYWGFGLIADLPVFHGVWDDWIMKLGIAWHYASIRRGVIDIEDVSYFLSLIAIFTIATAYVIRSKHS